MKTGSGTAWARQGQRDRKVIIPHFVALGMAGLVGAAVIWLGIRLLGDIDWSWGRYSLAVAGLVFGLAGFFGAAVVFWLTQSTKRDREAAERLVSENQELGSRAQRALARREVATR